eukprot:m.762542 g.762542  ORF g.762542 m.762542 type:complete len:247 (-) comp59051_c0_seq25:3206-3946(-)
MARRAEEDAEPCCCAGKRRRRPDALQNSCHPTPLASVALSDSNPAASSSRPLLRVIEESAEQTFAVEPVASADLERLADLCDKLSLEHFSSSQLAELLQTTDTMNYVKILETKQVSIGLFVLKQGAEIPLHNHPNMTVLSKCVQGEVKIQSFDWTRSDQQATRQSPACATSKGVFFVNAKSKPKWLYPAERNIHSIEAVADAVFLDIISPPYSDARPCAYYRVCETETQPAGPHGEKLIMLELLDG